MVNEQAVKQISIRVSEIRQVHVLVDGCSLGIDLVKASLLLLFEAFYCRWDKAADLESLAEILIVMRIQRAT